MEKVLAEQNPHWVSNSYDGLIQRSAATELLTMLSLKEVFVLLGVRRSGKTTVFKLIMNHLLENTDPKSILYINLDDPFFDTPSMDGKGLYTIIENSERLTRTKVEYLFLDEIQNIVNWEKYVKSVYDSGRFKKIFVTGSNSNLLQGSYAKLLSGRYISRHIYPLSIKEVLEHHQITDQLSVMQNKAQVLSLLDSMLFFGSFVEPLQQDNPSLKREILISYYDTILLKDCIAQDHIRNTRLIRELAHYLITNITASFSYASVRKFLNSNEHTLKEYIETLKNGFLFNELKNFSYSLKQQNKKKLYCVDNGLISSVAFSFSPNKGKLFENLIFTELQKYGAKEIFFLNETKQCDFIVKNNNEITCIQACYELNSDNQKREIAGLEFAMEQTNAKKGIIVTFDQKETIEENTEIIPVWALHDYYGI